jgi:hypothetical protein
MKTLRTKSLGKSSRPIKASDLKCPLQALLRRFKEALPRVQPLPLLISLKVLQCSGIVALKVLERGGVGRT